MSYYYPQAAMTVNVLFEDFKVISDVTLQKTYALNVQAKNITININDYKTSDTFDCEIDYKNFPFDPRTIRSAQVSLHIEDTKALYNDNGTINKIIPSDDNAVFLGFVDEENIELDDSKRVVRFTGRDLTALLIDQKYQESAPLSLTDPLDVVVKNLLAAFPATKRLKVVNATGSAGLPTLSKYDSGLGDPLSGGRNAGSHETYWDIIQDIVGRAGLIAYMHIDTLYISDPRTVFNSNNAIKFIYGKNIKNLSFKRKLGRHRGFNVLVRCLSEKQKTVIIAKLPEEGTADWCKALSFTPGQPVSIPKLNPDGSVSQDTNTNAPYLAFRISNSKVTDHAALVQVGQKIFEELVRQDIEGSLETLEMVGHSGNTTNDQANYKVYDLTTGMKNGIPLDIGQPVSVEIDTDDLVAISRLAQPGDRVQYLVQKGYDPTVASVFAKTLGKMTPIFYTKGVQLTLNQDSGFKMKLNFINYIDLSNKGLL